MERVFATIDERYGGPVGRLRERGFDPEPLQQRLTH